jgi:pimeloyl-ACP methyl ester carboxylesterase
MLNRLPQFRIELDGTRIHFIHCRAETDQAIPLIATHGWQPSGFVELLPLVPLLTDPTAHDIDGPAFDLVIPSLPGYGFSERPSQPITTRDTADLWHRLMAALGYDRYGAHGGDFGAGVTTFMALDQSEPLLGIHLSSLENTPFTGPGSPSLTDAERAYVAASQRWTEEHGGYKAIQSTRPQSLAYGLQDSPAGLAAWIVDKWWAWSDSGGDLDATLSRDVLLTHLTIYWATGTIDTSLRDYRDNRGATYTLGPDDFVDVPTAFAVFSDHHIDEPVPPRAWVDRLYRVQRWTPMPRGGHFPAQEAPELLARDIAAFFAHQWT